MTSTLPFPQVETESVDVTRPAEGVALIRIRSEPLGVLRQGVKRARLPRSPGSRTTRPCAA